MAKLIVREGPGRGTAYELVEDATKIGRDPENGVQFPPRRSAARTPWSSGPPTAKTNRGR